MWRPGISFSSESAGPPFGSPALSKRGPHPERRDRDPQRVLSRNARLAGVARRRLLAVARVVHRARALLAVLRLAHHFDLVGAVGGRVEAGANLGALVDRRDAGRDRLAAAQDLGLGVDGQRDAARGLV